MKTLWKVVVLVLFLLAGCNDDDDPLGNWVKKNAFEAYPRGGAVCFVIDNQAYVGLGYYDDADDEYLTDFSIYDSSTDSWNTTSVKPFPGIGRTEAVAFSVNGKGYVGTGYDGENSKRLSDFWEYDPATNTWKKMDDFPGGGRYSACAFAIGNYGYVGTGYGDGLIDNTDFYRFDPTAASGSQWTKVRSLGGDKREDAMAFTYNGKGYVFAGYNKTSGGYLNDMYEYDPSADTWTKKTLLDDDDNWTIMRKAGCAFVLDNKAYVALGQKSGTILDVWEYDFTTDLWTEKTPFEKTGRYNAVSFVVNGKAFVATGESGSTYFDDVYEFKPWEEYDDED